jgi:serine/threonine-protein kinase
VDTPGGESSLLGQTLNQKYRIISELGSGSMGTVYLAEHIGLKKQIAIKVLRESMQVSEESLKRFQREGIAAGKFTHPGAIQIFDFDRSEDLTCFLAMEYVKGTTLKAMIQQEGRLDLETAVETTRQVLSVLDEAHREGIVHRDLKPENIMVLGNGDRSIKVLDFGLSKLVDLPGADSIQTQAGRIMGSPRYMAPEQCSGGVVDHRIDLYAVGLILYEMISGDSPFPGENVTEIMMKRISDPAPLLSEKHPDLKVPADMVEFIRKALRRDPEERYQSAKEMIEVLDALDYSRIAKFKPRKPAPAGGGSSLSRLVVPALIGVLVIIAIAVGTILVAPGNGDGGGDFAFVSAKSPGNRTEEENRYIARLDEARSGMRSRQYTTALAAVEEAVHMGCADAEVYLLRGTIYRRRGELDMARADFDEALKMESTYAAAAAGLGWILLDKGDAKAALAQFEKASEMDDGCAEAVAGQGAAQFRIGDRPKAKALLLRAIEIDSSLALAHYYLGKTLTEDGTLDEAVNAFIQAKRHDTRALLPYLGLGEVYQRMGELDKAELQFRDALELDASSLEALTALAVLLVDRERFSEAQPLLESGIQRHPGTGPLHVLLGVTHEAAGHTSQAIDSLKKGIELSPGDGDARILLGILYHRRGELDEAVEQYQAATEADTTSAVPFINEGLALCDLGLYEDAANAFSKALTVDPESAFVYYNLGVLYKDYLEREDLTIEYFKQFEKLGGLDSVRNRKVRQWLESKGH